ncbi:MAG: argininosuccinate lyase [Planctomycetes bacterium]|nr:argininosuccinate lyase [Planctomycetota bacterium]
MAKIIRSRFAKELDNTIANFVSCIEDDKHFALQDVDGSIAHAMMLASQGVIPKPAANKIISSLKEIKKLVNNNGFKLDPALEDVHMNIEGMLKEKIGDDANYLHTARSRNDQVALDIVLYTIEAAKKTLKQIGALETSIAKCALKNMKAVMPTYTHLQRAQPALFSHILSSFVASLERDRNKMNWIINNHSVSPLGAGASIGTSLNISPSLSASLCGLKGVFANSIDAVSNRDCLSDYVYGTTLTFIHLSQIAETLIIWSSTEFGFISLPDDICTGSSIMPQKKNPDAIELIRAKAAKAVGDLCGLLGMLKALPAGYNRDLQETKPLLISSEQSLLSALKVMQITFEKLEINRDKMLAACDESIFATDLVETMVNKGMAFRQAYSLVAKSIKEGKFGSLAKKYGMSTDPYKSACSKTSGGGTAPQNVEKFLGGIVKNVRNV